MAHPSDSHELYQGSSSLQPSNSPRQAFAAKRVFRHCIWPILVAVIVSGAIRLAMQEFGTNAPDVDIIAHATAISRSVKLQYGEEPLAQISSLRSGGAEAQLLVTISGAWFRESTFLPTADLNKQGYLSAAELADIHDRMKSVQSGGVQRVSAQLGYVESILWLADGIAFCRRSAEVDASTAISNVEDAIVKAVFGAEASLGSVYLGL